MTFRHLDYLNLDAHTAVSKTKKEEEKSLSSEELKELLLQSKDNPDDCLMCGS